MSSTIYVLGGKASAVCAQLCMMFYGGFVPRLPQLCHGAQFRKTIKRTRKKRTKDQRIHVDSSGGTRCPSGWSVGAVWSDVRLEGATCVLLCWCYCAVRIPLWQMVVSTRKMPHGNSFSSCSQNVVLFLPTPTKNEHIHTQKCRPLSVA